jgi:hypothetical protein
MFHPDISCGTTATPPSVPRTLRRISPPLRIVRAYSFESVGAIRFIPPTFMFSGVTFLVRRQRTPSSVSSPNLMTPYVTHRSPHKSRRGRVPASSISKRLSRAAANSFSASARLGEGMIEHRNDPLLPLQWRNADVECLEFGIVDGLVNRSAGKARQCRHFGKKEMPEEVRTKPLRTDPVREVLAGRHIAAHLHHVAHRSGA